MVLHDKTGVGVAIDEMLSGLPFPFLGVTFTNSSKTNMVTELMIAIETASIGLPRWRVLLQELDAYEVRTNQLGMMFYEAQNGKHDDTVTALFLAWHSLLHHGGDMAVKFIDDPVKDEDNSLNDYLTSEDYDD